ncbi:hypothetical protein KC19_VG251500 [Ceratodon purpureus]|uniref:Uncharacterized protein n=1 Tax=Ceratodon purpureus TaxID=3225 RepID=A0A8T0HTK5_CERPU|nr:hypothetical protein KC19_VG251500 [Ceratodon purpureus]
MGLGWYIESIGSERYFLGNSDIALYDQVLDEIKVMMTTPIAEKAQMLEAMLEKIKDARNLVGDLDGGTDTVEQSSLSISSVLLSALYGSTDFVYVPITNNGIFTHHRRIMFTELHKIIAAKSGQEVPLQPSGGECLSFIIRDVKEDVDLMSSAPQKDDDIAITRATAAQHLPRTSHHDLQRRLLNEPQQFQKEDNDSALSPATIVPKKAVTKSSKKKSKPGPDGSHQVKFSALPIKGVETTVKLLMNIAIESFLEGTDQSVFSTFLSAIK